MNHTIYLDNNATTVVDERIINDPYVLNILKKPLNPSSFHEYGREAKNILLKAKRTIGSYLSVSPDNIIFTSGATEGLNLCIQGALCCSGHIITTSIEHACVYNTLIEMQKKGCRLSYVEVSDFGAPLAEDIEKLIQPDTKLIVISAVNSETGVKVDIDRVAQIAKKHSIPLVVDGVALLGKEVFQIPEGVSAMCFSGHKIHTPGGIGFIYHHRSFHISPLIYGGGQENNLRSGTQNLFGIACLEKAIILLQEELPLASEKMRSLRDHFEASLKSKLDIEINGKGLRVVNTSNISFLGIDAETLLIYLDRHHVSASHGSACDSGGVEPSRILINMGLAKERVKSALRFSLCRMTTKKEIDKAVKIIIDIVQKIKSIK